MPDEPVISDIIKTGVDILTFSGDKLLGGPQAGIIMGKKKYIEMLKFHPLNRALRVDKFTLSALESVVKEYLNEKKVFDNILSLKLITQNLTIIKKRALKIKRATAKNKHFNINIKTDFSFVGGGAFPMNKIKSIVLEIIHKHYSASKIDSILRTSVPPVVGRIKDDIFIIDVRTVFDNQIKELSDVLSNL